MLISLINRGPTLNGIRASLCGHLILKMCMSMLAMQETATTQDP